MYMYKCYVNDTVKYSNHVSISKNILM